MAPRRLDRSAAPAGPIRWPRLLAGLICLLLTSSPSDGSPDERLSELVNLRTDRFPFDPPESAQAWNQRAAALRRQVQVAAGLWPPPDRPTPRATVHRRVERDGYTVEAISLPTLPGLRLTGSLYRPTGPRSGPMPAVLSPHGHWGGGRFHRWDDDEFAEQVELGAEVGRESGRFPLQARCAHLARQGCVVFLYDMLGYADNRRLDLIAVHAPSEETILDEGDRWGFYSTQAELRLQGPLGVQTYNSLCALDWLESRDDVDPSRIAVTGGSSGATQTLVLCAVDDRPAAAFPVVMVSTAMQGGCGCENACCLRIGTSNVELAALMAPKPLGMASADDWTRGFDEDGYPELRMLYAMLGAPGAITHANLVQYPHNYNRASRAAMYEWLGQHLRLDAARAGPEADFVPLSDEEASIVDRSRELPAADRSTEVELMRSIDRMSSEQMRRLAPQDAVSLRAYRETVRSALGVVLGGAQEGSAPGEFVESKRASAGEHTLVSGLVRHDEAGVDLPAVAVVPEGASIVTVVTSSSGLRAVVDAEGEPTDLAVRLLRGGSAVVGADLFAQGSLAPEGGTLKQAPIVPGMRPVPSLTYGYNRTPVAHRVGDLLSVLSAAHGLIPGSLRIALVGDEGTVAYVAPALAVNADAVDAALVMSGGFRYESLTSWRDPRFLPGAVKYGDVPAMLALAAPTPLTVVGETPERLGLVGQAYVAAGASGRLTIVDGEATAESAIERFAASISSLRSKSQP